jgi:hypothetical protein
VHQTHLPLKVTARHPGRQCFGVSGGRSSYGRAQGRSRAAFDMDGDIARLLFAVAFSEPGSDSFSTGVSAVVMAPLRGGRPGTGGRRFDPASGRGTCGLSWPARADVTGTGDGGHGRESWFAAMLDL